MKARRVLALLLAAGITVTSLAGCGGESAESSSQESSVVQEATPTPEPTAKPTPEPTPTPEPINLDGTWVQVNSGSDTAYQAAGISGNRIEIWWIDEENDMQALFWAGSVDLPDSPGSEFSWDSINDTSLTDFALMASSEETKEFTYSNGQISFNASIMDVSGTIKMEKISDTPPEMSESNTSDTEIPTDDILSQLETSEYSYTSYGFQYAFLKIKNGSSYNLDISVDAEFFDAGGNLVGVKHLSQEAFESGSTILLYSMPDEEYANVEYTISPELEKYYDCVISELSYEAHETSTKVILDVKNNGDKPAEFVEGSVLFFKAGEVIGYTSNYFTDDDSELKPGESIKQEMECYDEYDSYEVFLTGRRSK